MAISASVILRGLTEDLSGNCIAAQPLTLPSPVYSPDKGIQRRALRNQAWQPNLHLRACFQGTQPQTQSIGQKIKTKGH